MIAHVVDREVFVPSPRHGVAAGASSYYTTREGGNLVSIHGFASRSDTTDVAFRRTSHDNGRTWSEPAELPTQFRHPDGTKRRSYGGGYVDPPTGRFITIWNEGILPTDDPLEGMRRWTLHYSVSEDGGRSTLAGGQIIHEGDRYDEIHHLPGVTVGKNCAMMGDLGQRPLTRSDGVILVPVQSSPVGADGEYYNPGAGFTFTDCLLLMGTWKPDGRLAWTASERVVGDPELTTRGLIEPTIAELTDGALIMVMRGSNDARPELPGRKWIARSFDGGQTWTGPTPWTYDDGEPFYSPSSCSQLLPYSDGRLLWIGNICETNPKGNGPRYPIVLGEVDRASGLLRRSTVSALDDRQPGESAHLTLSNFYCREDRESGGLALHLTRLFAHDFRRDGNINWTADSLIYRIAMRG